MLPLFKKRRAIIILVAIVSLLLTVWGWDSLVGNTFFSFNGRVMSVDGSPIAGATVTIEVVTNNFFQVPVLWGTIRGTARSMTLKTNASGQFSMHGLHGNSLEVSSIRKSGFDAESVNHEASSFVFGAGGSDKGGRPPKYVLAPLGPSIGNVRGHFTFDATRDGRKYVVGLVAGRVLAPGEGGGNLTFSVTGPEHLKTQPTQRWSWSTTIAAINGELVETADPVSLKAPPDGYRKSYTYDIRPAVPAWEFPDNQWKGQLPQNFYFRTRDGELYAWCEIRITSFSDGAEEAARVTINYFYNTRGSRDLFRPRKP